jgi:hypothetical protein
MYKEKMHAVWYLKTLLDFVSLLTCRPLSSLDALYHLSSALIR